MQTYIDIYQEVANRTGLTRKQAKLFVLTRLYDADGENCHRLLNTVMTCDQGFTLHVRMIVRCVLNKVRVL